MNNVLAFPDLGRRRRRRRQDVCQADRLLIDRRARQLAAEYQEYVFMSLLVELKAGWLDPALIAYWRPLAGLPQRKEI